jgi:fumarylacetoacetase
LPFGVVRPHGDDARVVVRIEDRVLDLAAAGIAPELTARPILNALMASGRGSEVRDQAGELLNGKNFEQFLLDLDDVDVLLPVAVGDYVDFYSSIHHATNLGKIFRPEGEALLPNWRQIPVGYHGRTGTIVVSGTPITRPRGVVTDLLRGNPSCGPSETLDFELEVGFFVGGSTASHIAPDTADAHIFGAVLCNDWSARDIQRFEYQPLGPHLGKSFATTISPWVVTLDALRPYLVRPPKQDPTPASYLRARRPWALDIDLQVTLNDEEITRTNFAGMYWTFAQQLAHITVNGATTRAGDFFASGTVSGPNPGEWGSLIEASWNGTKPLMLMEDVRSFLEDGDTVTLRGWCGDGTKSRPRIGFGEATGTVVPAPEERRD